MTDPIRLDIADGLATLTLARPAAANALDIAACEAFARRAAQIAAASDVRAILLQAEGKNFCVGGDVSLMGAQGADRAQVLTAMVAPLHRGLAILAGLDAPLVAAVRGAAAGAGLSLVAGADLVVASRSATFLMAYTGIGLTADGGATWHLPRIIGTRRTLELALTNRRLDAQEALAWGLVTRIAEDAELDAAALSLAQRLAGGPTAAFGHVRRLVARSLSADFVDHLGAEQQAIVASGASADAGEGVANFLQRRPPAFRA